MRISRIHAAQSLTADATIQLADETAHYVGKVLRARPGDSLALFNSRDGEFIGEISSVEKKTVHVTLGDRVENCADPKLSVHLGLGISRGERMDYAIQKATEAGVGCITPLLTERCEVKLKGDRVDNRLAHWERVAISACEQSGRCVVPVIQSPVSLQDWLQAPRDGLRFVLDHRGNAGFPVGGKPDGVTLLVGPEGGLADEEVTASIATGFRSVRLGPRVLRTETAPVVAIAVLQQLWGDY